jgi:hypothetical protein
MPDLTAEHYRVVQNRPFRGRTFRDTQNLTVVETPKTDDEVTASMAAGMLACNLIEKQAKAKPAKALPAASTESEPGGE